MNTWLTLKGSVVVMVLVLLLTPVAYAQFNEPFSNANVANTDLNSNMYRPGHVYLGANPAGSPDIGLRLFVYGGNIGQMSLGNPVNYGSVHLQFNRWGSFGKAPANVPFPFNNYYGTRFQSIRSATYHQVN